MFDHCQFPQLTEPYHTALQQAVRFIWDYVDPLAIIAAGSIIRGQPNPNSDFDLYVIHAPHRRQRVQRFFNGVPTEIFINPPHQVERYFEEERESGQPSTSHMLVTGFVVFERDSILEELRQRAQHELARPPAPSTMQLKMLRYNAMDMYENAVDIQHDDPENALMLLNEAVMVMLRYYFLKSGHYLPRHKEWLQSLPPELEALARQFYRGEQPFETAAKIADLTIETRGFYEWETDWQNV